MRRTATNESSLDALLLQMIQQQQAQQRQQSATRAVAARPAAATSSPSPEEKQSMMKAIPPIGGRVYTWAELSQPDVRRLPEVQAAIAAVQRDPAAFGLTPADVPWIVQYSTGAYDGFSESQLYEATVEALPQAEAAKGENMATKLTPGANAPAIDGKTAFQEIAKIAGSPEGRIALQRQRTGQSLDPGQRALVQRHDQLVAANNAQAHLERPPSSAPAPMRVYLGSDVLPWVKNPSETERRHLSSEYRAKVLGDPSHAYWNAQSTEHKAAVLGMKIATEMMQTGNSYVQLNEDGSIQEE
jgi:hypothetical protein